METTALHPTPAAQARAIVAANASLTLTWHGGRIELVGGHLLHGSEVWVALPSTSALMGFLRGDDDVPVRLEFTDVCPVSVRRRTRARLVLDGWLSLAPPDQLVDTCVQTLLEDAADSRLLRLDVAEVQLAVDGADGEQVPPEDFLTGTTDLLALDEAHHLQHLVAHHADALDLLARLVEPRVAQAATRIVPSALTAVGITLRVERRSSDADVLLPFTAPLVVPDELGLRLGELLDAALARPCRPLVALDGQS